MILVLSEIFPPRHGGSGRWFFELYKRLSPGSVMIYTHSTDDKHEVDVDSNFPQTIVRTNYANAEWGFRSLSGLMFYIRSFLALRKKMPEETTQIHCGRCLHEGVLGAILSKLTRKKLIVYIHGEDIETARSSRELTLLAQWVINSADCLITNSHNTKRILTEYWNTAKTRIETVHPGVDVKRFKPAKRDTQFIDDMGWTDRYVITTVGRLQRRKGQDMMIKSLIDIKKSIPNVLYCIAGDGEDKQYLKDIAIEYGVEEHVQFLSSVEDNQLVRIYQQCQLFVLPNRTEGNDIEGFGMVLVEAQACGKPVIAGESGGTSEALVKGLTGETVDCTDLKKLSAAIVNVYENRTQYTEALCREFALSLSWDEHTIKANSLFDNID